MVTVSNSKIIHATLGPDGTYSSQAAKQMMGVEGELLFYPTIGEVFKAVLSGEVQKGIVPILNSGEGPVNPTMMALIACGALVQIEEEFVLPINHVLVTRPGYTLEDVQVVYSHPQALGQCRRYLNGNLPNTRTVESNSTVAAVPDMLGSSVPAAAIAPQSVLKLYEGEIVPIKIGIQDNSHNYDWQGKWCAARCYRARYYLSFLRIRRRRSALPSSKGIELFFFAEHQFATSGVAPRSDGLLEGYLHSGGRRTPGRSCDASRACFIAVRCFYGNDLGFVSPGYAQAYQVNGR